MLQHDFPPTSACLHLEQSWNKSWSCMARVRPNRLTIWKGKVLGNQLNLHKGKVFLYFWVQITSPFAAITASTPLGRLLNRFWNVAEGDDGQAGPAHSLCFRSSLECSVGFSSGLWPLKFFHTSLGTKTLIDLSLCTWVYCHAGTGLGLLASVKKFCNVRAYKDIL